MGIPESMVLLVLVIGVLILTYLGITKRVIRRAFANGAMIVEGNGTGNATSASRWIDLEKLPSFDFREKEVGCSPVSCAICLSNFRGSNKCRFLPICKHSFHMECVDEWLLAKAHCPIFCGTALTQLRWWKTLLAWVVTRMIEGRQRVDPVEWHNQSILTIEICQSQC